jgi:hypothetical protein
MDAKTGETTIDVLHSKHPDARVPDISDFDMYDILPDFIELDIMEEVN